MACASTALLVGGGIAGLSAATALSRVGVHCDVVELANAPLGASLGISGRAAEALDELGVYDQVHDRATAWSRDTKVAALFDSTGRLLAPSPERPDWPGSKAPLGVYRPVLLSIMADKAKSLGVEIRRGVTAATIEEGDDDVTVTFSDGESRRYDFVVGADGIGSRTRTELFPEAPKPIYAGQMSIRWMAPGPAIQPEGWYVSPVGRMGFYYLPQGMVYVASVIDEAVWTRKTDSEVFTLFSDLLESYTAPAIVELRERLSSDHEIICRPFEWVFLPDTWHKGRTILIGDAAHATTAHMGMGGGMALEDAVVLAQCVASGATVMAAFRAFMDRRLARARIVVETSVALSQLEQSKAPPSENRRVMASALETLAQPY